LCSSFGHIAPHCSQFRSSTQQPSAHLVVGNVSAATWFPDTGANQHVTPDLGTLTDSAPYLGNDYLHVGDGKGLDISHIGHTKLHSPKRMFTLSNAFVCVMLGFDERLCAGIDDFNVCVLLRFDERLCAGIHYCMCVFCWTFVTDYVLELIIACVCVCVHTKIM